MGKKPSFPEKVIYICQGSKCRKRGGTDLEKFFEKVIKSGKLGDEVEIVITECTDRCKFAPIMCFQPENIWLSETNETEAFKVFKEIMDRAQS